MSAKGPLYDAAHITGSIACSFVWLTFSAASNVLAVAANVLRMSSLEWKIVADEIKPGVADTMFASLAPESPNPARAPQAS